MDLYERNELRLAALSRVDTDVRRKYFIGRMLEVNGDDPKKVTYGLNFSVPDHPRILPPWPKVDAGAGAKDVYKDLDKDGLRLLGIPGLRDLPVTHLQLRGAFGGATGIYQDQVRSVFGREELAGARSIDLTTAQLGAATKFVAGSKHLGGLTALELRGCRVKLPELLASKGLKSIGHLGLAGNGLKSKDLLDVVESPAFPKLTSLDFAANPLNGAGLEKLAGAESMARLESLNLETAGRMEGGNPWKAIAKSKHLRGLRRLLLGSNPGGPAALDLLASGNLPNLEELSIQYTGSAAIDEIDLPALRRLTIILTNPKALSAFAEHPIMSQIEDLTLHHAGMATVETFEALYASDGFRNLRSLSLPGGVRTSDEAAALARLPRFKRLRSLTIGEVAVDGAMMAAMLEKGGLAHLEELAFPSAAGPETVTALAASADLAGLEALRVGGESIQDAGGVAIAGSRHLKKLQLLDLGAHTMGDLAFQALAASPNFKRLVCFRPPETATLRSSEAVQEKFLRLENMPKVWLFGGVSDNPDIRPLWEGEAP